MSWHQCCLSVEAAAAACAVQPYSQQMCVILFCMLHFSPSWAARYWIPLLTRAGPSCWYLVATAAVCGVQLGTASQRSVHNTLATKVSVDFNVSAPNVQGTTTINIVSLGGTRATCTNSVGGELHSSGLPQRTDSVIVSLLSVQQVNQR